MSLELETPTLPMRGIDISNEVDPNTIEDRYFYGWRYVPRKAGPDGVERSVQVPLTKADVLHPQEADFIVTNKSHSRDWRYLSTIFERLTADISGMRVFADHRIDWQVPRIEPLGPDIAVFEGVSDPWDPSRGTFPVQSMNARTLFVIEVTSPNTRDAGFGTKVDEYHAVGIPLYIIVDRRMVRGVMSESVHAFDSGPTAYVPRQIDQQVGVWIDPLKIWLKVSCGRSICVDANGRELLDDLGMAAKMAAMEEEIRRLKGE